MFRIKTNKNDELTIASRKVKSDNFELLDNPDKISDSLVVWYSANRLKNRILDAKDLDPGGTISPAIQRLIQTTEYPLYTKWSKKYLDKKWDEAEIEIEKQKNINDQIKAKYFLQKHKRNTIKEKSTLISMETIYFLLNHKHTSKLRFLLKHHIVLLLKFIQK